MFICVSPRILDLTQAVTIVINSKKLQFVKILCKIIMAKINATFYRPKMLIILVILFIITSYSRKKMFTTLEEKTFAISQFLALSAKFHIYKKTFRFNQSYNLRWKPPILRHLLFQSIIKSFKKHKKCRKN